MSDERPSAPPATDETDLTADERDARMREAVHQALLTHPDQFRAAIRSANEANPDRQELMAAEMADAIRAARAAEMAEAIRTARTADLSDADRAARAEEMSDAIRAARAAQMADAIRAAREELAAEAEAARTAKPIRRKPGTPTAAESSATPLPQFLIIGAQKSATRWLRLNLGQHPEVFTAELELSFFNDGPTFRLGAEWYAEQFLGWEEQPIVGEATPGYMIWRHDPSLVAKRMHGFNPELRLIAILRNPIDRAYSGLVHHLRRERLPADTELLEYVSSRDPLDDRLCLVTGSWYAASLEPYIERFGDQLLVLMHDDIGTDPIGVYEQAVAHIGASPGFVPEELAAVRFGNTPPKESGLRRQRGTGYRELTVAQRWALWDFFADDVAKLETMLGRDLSMWRPAQPPA